MTALAVVAAAAPFLRRLDEPKARQSEDAGVYRDQLKEIEREQAAGLIEAASAADARREIARRLIIAEREASAPMGRIERGDRSFAAIGVASAIAIGSTLLYANIGSPDLPSHTPGGRMAGATIDKGAEPASNEASPGDTADAAPEEQPAVSRQGAGTVDEMIEKLAIDTNL